MIDSDIIVAFCVGVAMGIFYAVIICTLKDLPERLYDKAEKEQTKKRDNGFPRNLS